MRLAHLSVFSLAALPATASADVLVVRQIDPGGGFTQVQDAIDAAVDGDIIVVMNGVYQAITINGKALTIVEGPNQFASIVGESHITSLPLGKSVVLSQLLLRGIADNHPTKGRALTITNCLGPVHIESCDLVGSSNFVAPGDCQGLFDDNGWPGLWIEGSYQVVVTHGAISGGDGLMQPGGLGCGKENGGGNGAPGAYTTGSRLALFHTTVTGGAGGFGGHGGDGGNGLSVPANSVFLYGATITGGKGGGGFDWASGNGGDGGHGVALSAPGFSVAVGTTAIGGAGGPSDLFTPGAPGEAFVVPPAGTFAGPARDFRATSVAAQGAQVKLEFDGAAQELPLVMLSAGDLWLSLAPMPALLLVSPTDILVMPPLPASGELDVTLSAPALPAGIEGFALPLQAAFLGAGGELAVGPARHLTLLASAPTP